MRLIDMDTMWQCETCFHHKSNGCDTWCDAGEAYRPAASKLKVIDPASLRTKGECKFCSKEDNGALCWDCSDLGISIEYRAGRIRVTNEYGDEAYLGVNFCPNCGADMRGTPNDS